MRHNCKSKYSPAHRVTNLECIMESLISWTSFKQVGHSPKSHPNLCMQGSLVDSSEWYRGILLPGPWADMSSLKQKWVNSVDKIILPPRTLPGGGLSSNRNGHRSLLQWTRSQTDLSLKVLKKTEQKPKQNSRSIKLGVPRWRTQQGETENSSQPGWLQENVEKLPSHDSNLCKA